MVSVRQSDGIERTFGDDQVIVSKTDVRGFITYANSTFVAISGYTERELIGKPHNLVRHPDMPRCVFRFFWERLSAGHEIFAYVKNRCKNGDYYWVLAHATPSHSPDGTLVGYHSARRTPHREALNRVIIPTYRALLDIEQQDADRKVGMERAYAVLLDTIGKTEMDYDQWVFSLFDL
jgi:PAS domain S-box-containing protein